MSTRQRKSLKSHIRLTSDTGIVPNHRGRWVVIIGVFLFGITLMAQQKPGTNTWAQFRGPNGSGLSETTGLPLEFGPDKNVIWRINLATGYSSPVLTEDYVLVTACDEEKLLTLCLLRKDGSLVWKKEAPRPRKEKIDNRNNPASPSPISDGKNVYVFFPDFGLLAYDLKGNELWKLPLGPYNNIYGMGASPILAEDLVILVCDQNIGSYIIAVDKGNGKVVWKNERPEAKSGHSTPILYRPERGELQVVVPGSFLLTSYSVKTGEKLWWVGGLSFEMKSTPALLNDVLFINGYATPLNQPENLVEVPAFNEALSKYDSNSNGLLTKAELPKESVYSWFEFVDIAGDGSMDDEDWTYFRAALASLNGMLAIRLGGQGDMTEANTIWQYHRAVPQLPSPLIYQNVLYMVNDGGVVTSFKPESGEVIKKGRLKGGGSQYYASPVAADGKVFIISRKGKVSVLHPDGNLTVMASTDLKEECYATPAIAEGRIYLRTVNTLYCFGSNDNH